MANHYGKTVQGLYWASAGLMAANHYGNAGMIKIGHGKTVQGLHWATHSKTMPTIYTFTFWAHIRQPTPDPSPPKPTKTSNIPRGPHLGVLAGVMVCHYQAGTRHGLPICHFGRF